MTEAFSVSRISKFGQSAKCHKLARFKSGFKRKHSPTPVAGKPRHRRFQCPVSREEDESSGRAPDLFSACAPTDRPSRRPVSTGGLETAFKPEGRRGATRKTFQGRQQRSRPCARANVHNIPCFAPCMWVIHMMRVDCLRNSMKWFFTH